MRLTSTFIVSLTLWSGYVLGQEEAAAPVKTKHDFQVIYPSASAIYGE